MFSSFHTVTANVTFLDKVDLVIDSIAPIALTPNHPRPFPSLRYHPWTLVATLGTWLAPEVQEARSACCINFSTSHPGGI